MGTPATPPPRPSEPPAPPRAYAAAGAPGPSLLPRGDLVISDRLLWVNRAAYPLENITRVYTFVLTPRRGEAFVQFLKRGGGTVVLILVLMLFSDMSGGSSDFDSSSGDDSVIQFLLVLAVLVLIYFFGEMASVVFASSHYTLAIETNGRSTALVAGDPRHLDALVVKIAETIDKPNAVLRARVETLSITNYGNYHFGDSVNIYGGSGHTGVLK
ncbi:hypothetical protein ACE1SV_73940 [Streptomyces sp. E-15]